MKTGALTHLPSRQAARDGFGAGHGEHCGGGGAPPELPVLRPNFGSPGFFGTGCFPGGGGRGAGSSSACGRPSGLATSEPGQHPHGLERQAASSGVASSQSPSARHSAAPSGSATHTPARQAGRTGGRFTCGQGVFGQASAAQSTTPQRIVSSFSFSTLVTCGAAGQQLPQQPAKVLIVQSVSAWHSGAGPFTATQRPC